MTRRVDGWPPRWLSPGLDGLPSDGGRISEFVEAYCTITKDTIAGRSGEPLVLRGWQRALLDGLFVRRSDGRRKHRQGLIGLPRKNGKSALGSGIALAGLLIEQDGAEVYSCAGDREQARIVFSSAKRMIELNEELSSLTKLYRDAIEVPETGSVYRVLSSEAPLKEGLSPTLVIFDELHVQPNDELWNTMNLGSGARVNPLVLGITTAGVRTDSLGRDTVCFRLYEHGKRVARGEVDDPTFFFAWWEPLAGSDCNHADPAVWAESNPAFDDLVSAEDFASTVVKIPEAEFRTKRTNVFVTSAESALPHGAWDACADLDRVVDRDDSIVVGFDGSYSGDSTGIVACTTSGDCLHLFVVDAWERPADDQHWRVPIADVEQVLRETYREFVVSEVACDPARWQRSLELLLDDGLPVVEFPNTPARMSAAWQTFYDAVMDGKLSHDGDPRLARHIENMVLKRDARGVRPTKEFATSGRKIDLGIAAVMAYSRAVVVGDVAPFVSW